MPKWLKIIGYILIGIVSFVIFLYLTFPFDVIKDRLLAEIEKSSKGQYEVTVATVNPKLLVGVTLKGVKVNKRTEGKNVPMLEADQIGLKVSIFSLIFGSPKVKFDVRMGDSRISGRAVLGKGASKVTVVLDELNLATFHYLASELGLQVKSQINGEIDVDVNSRQIIRSSGAINIEPNGIQILPSKLKTGVMGEIDLPAMTIGAGKSLISAELKRGAIKITSLKLEKGDLNIDLKGSIYLSSNVSNFRLNLKGDFSFSEKLGQALPFLFIIEKQKKEDGKFPLTIAGRISKPQIKIGDFTVPL